jgi:hypothetical protein
MGKKPDYVTSSLFGTTIRGIMQGLGAGKKATKGGDWMQVGGEFLFVKNGKEGAMWPVTWAHRMKTTRDHAEIKELRSVLGMEMSDEVNGAPATKSETKPKRSSTFFGRKDKDAKKEDKSEGKGKEEATEAAAST